MKLKAKPFICSKCDLTFVRNMFFLYFDILLTPNATAHIFHFEFHDVILNKKQQQQHTRSSIILLNSSGRWKPACFVLFIEEFWQGPIMKKNSFKCKNIIASLFQILRTLSLEKVVQCKYILLLKLKAIWLLCEIQRAIKPRCQVVRI